MAIDKKALGNQLRSWRTNIGMGQSELAKRTNISASYVSYLEKGKKIPTLPVALALASTLGLKPPERDSLLQAAGYKATLDPAVEEVFTPIHCMLGQHELTAEEREDLSRAVQAFVADWRSQLERRKLKTQKEIVVAAGWQPRLLSSQTLERERCYMRARRSRRQAFLTCMLLSQGSRARRDVNVMQLPSEGPISPHKTKPSRFVKWLQIIDLTHVMI